MKTIQELSEQIESNDSLRNEFQQNPIDTIKKMSIAPSYTQDIWIYRTIVIVLGLAVIAIIVGVIILMINNGKGLKDLEIPTILTALGSAAIGAIAGLLAPNPNK